MTTICGLITWSKISIAIFVESEKIVIFIPFQKKNLRLITFISILWYSSLQIRVDVSVFSAVVYDAWKRIVFWWLERISSWLFLFCTSTFFFSLSFLSDLLIQVSHWDSFKIQHWCCPCWKSMWILSWRMMSHLCTFTHTKN